MILVGIDPGSGISSPTGISAFDSETKKILFADTAGSQHDEVIHRIHEITSKVAWLLSFIPAEEQVVVSCESFVMRGAGGETLARLTGALMKAVPRNYKFQFVSNMTMKKVVTGDGKADKQMVAAAVLKFFNDSSQIKQMVDDKCWDILDSFGISIAGRTHGKAR